MVDDYRIDVESDQAIAGSRAIAQYLGEPRDAEQCTDQGRKVGGRRAAESPQGGERPDLRQHRGHAHHTLDEQAFDVVSSRRRQHAAGHPLDGAGVREVDRDSAGLRLVSQVIGDDLERDREAEPARRPLGFAWRRHQRLGRQRNTGPASQGGESTIVEPTRRSPDPVSWVRGPTPAPTLRF